MLARCYVCLNYGDPNEMKKLVNGYRHHTCDNPNDLSDLEKLMELEMTVFYRKHPDIPRHLPKKKEEVHK